MNDTELPPTPWNIGEPGGPSGPFYSLVAVNGNVIAMQIAERRYAELFAAAPDAQAENAKLRDELVKAAQLMREIRDAKNMHELNAALDAGSLSLSAADAAAEPREANVGLEVQNATLREALQAIQRECGDEKATAIDSLAACGTIADVVLGQPSESEATT